MVDSVNRAARLPSTHEAAQIVDHTVMTEPKPGKHQQTLLGNYRRLGWCADADGGASAEESYNVEQ